MQRIWKLNRVKSAIGEKRTVVVGCSTRKRKDECTNVTNLAIQNFTRRKSQAVTVILKHFQPKHCRYIECKYIRSHALTVTCQRSCTDCTRTCVPAPTSKDGGRQVAALSPLSDRISIFISSTSQDRDLCRNFSDFGEAPERHRQGAH